MPEYAPTEMDRLLWGALEELDGFDGEITASEIWDFLVARDGDCPYSVEEIEVWQDYND